MEFSHSRQIRCLNDKNLVPGLFDNRPKHVAGKSFRYDGTILGVPIRIKYTDRCEYFIEANSEEELSKVYNLVLDRILGCNTHSNGKSLAEILGIKQGPDD